MIQVSYGSCIEIDFVFRNEDGTTEDISGDTFEIFDASNASVFSAAVLIKVEPDLLHMTVPAESASRLKIGIENWFRLRRVFAEGCEDTTPQIPIWVV